MFVGLAVEPEGARDDAYPGLVIEDGRPPDMVAVVGDDDVAADALTYLIGALYPGACWNG